MVGFLDAADPFDTAVLEALPVAHASGGMLLPAVAYAESLVMVRRAGATDEWYRALLSRLAIRVGTLDARGCEMAASLRAEHLEHRRRPQRRKPGVLVVGEALAAYAARVVTTDADWPPVDGCRSRCWTLRSIRDVGP